MLPKYVKRVRTKGRDYLYFDTGKAVDGKKVYVRLPGLRDPGFGGSYAALLGHRHRKAPAETLRVPKLVDMYQRSDDYKRLAASSKKLYDIYLARFIRLLPTAPVAEITRGDMRKLADSMSDTPSAANAFISATGSMFGWANKREHITTNPCDGIEKTKDGEHQPWPDHVLRAALASDDMAVRLLTNMLYFTAQRLGDVLKMTWADISEDRMRVTQQKTSKVLIIPLHRDLKALLESLPDKTGTIVKGAKGGPVSGEMARKLLKAFTAAQNVPCVPHGLRKNAVITLLESGCSVAETAAISGQTLGMVEHYSKQRDQQKLAGEAMLRWEAN